MKKRNFVKAIIASTLIGPSQGAEEDPLLTRLRTEFPDITFESSDKHTYNDERGTKIIASDKLGNRATLHLHTEELRNDLRRLHNIDMDQMICDFLRNDFQHSPSSLS